MCYSVTATMNRRSVSASAAGAIVDDRKQRATKLMLMGLALALTGMSLSLGIYVEQPGRSINIAFSGAAVAVR